MRPTGACCVCDSSLWLRASTGVSAYCRQMHVLMTSPEEPAELPQDCDALHLARDQE
jgi:hypothetical protein